MPPPAPPAALQDKPPRKRLWVPWSLRILATAFGLLVCTALWIGLRAYRQHAALLEIANLGFRASLETRPCGTTWLREHCKPEWLELIDDVVTVRLNDTPATDELLLHVSRLHGVERILLDRTQVTDAGLTHLAGMNELQELSLRYTLVTDTGLKSLQALTGMKRLCLDGTGVSDAGLAVFRRMDCLEDLSLRYTNVTDLGLEALNRVISLKRLELEGTQVTDAGLVHLESFTKLSFLSVERSLVTDRGISRLRKLPALRELSLDNAQWTEAARNHEGDFRHLEFLWIDNRQIAEMRILENGTAEPEVSIADLVACLDVDVKRRHYEDDRSYEEYKDDFDFVLLEIIDRGGNEAERLLTSKLTKEDAERESLRKRIDWRSRPNDDLFSEWDRLSNNTELLTALRRVQRQPDPLTIVVSLPRDLKAHTRQLPTFTVSLKSVDLERRAIWVDMATHGHGTHRYADWRFEVRDQSGNVLRPRSNFGWNDFRGRKGIYCVGTCQFGESVTVSLPMADFVDIPDPGVYSVTILYHSKLPIADIPNPDDLKNLITYRSATFPLTVERAPKRLVRFSHADRIKTRSLVGELPEDGDIKMLRGPYDPIAHEFLEPDSPAGQLLTMEWRAVPALVEALVDPAISVHRKAWILSLLFTTTEERDMNPLRFNGSMPKVDTFGGNWNEALDRSRRIDGRQNRLISRWQKFADEYLELVEEGP